MLIFYGSHALFDGLSVMQFIIYITDGTTYKQ